MDVARQIARAKTHLMLHQPFFGSLAMSLKFIEDSEISTMCTDGKSVRYSPAFVEKYATADSVALIEGVIAHEVMHVALKHMLRRGDFDHKLWNMATDYAINQIVVDSGLTIPECGLLDEQYRGMSAEAIYNRLLQDPPPEEEGEGWNFGGVEPATGEDGSELSEAEADLMEADINGMVLQAHASAKMQGKLPAGIDGMIEEMTKPQVDWRDKLRLFIGGDQPDDYTWRNPNRKWYSGYGIYMPSVEHFGAGHVVIGVDTSGSVSDAELSQFLGEINAVSEDMQPKSITVVGCDSKVQSVDEYDQGESVQSLNSTGRGGTRVSPVFDLIEQRNLECDSLIYFTDLHVWDFPDAPEYPVLWVSTDRPEAPFGEVVTAKL
ncbi:hypothetical protein K0U83_22080 [bacterium]|nr:hypothetical protein [bacterium]